MTLETSLLKRSATGGASLPASKSNMSNSLQRGSISATAPKFFEDEPVYIRGPESKKKLLDRSTQKEAIDKFVGDLLNMGLTVSAAKKALEATGYKGVEAALNWALDHGTEDLNSSIEMYCGGEANGVKVTPLKRKRSVTNGLCSSTPGSNASKFAAPKPAKAPIQLQSKAPIMVRITSDTKGLPSIISPGSEPVKFGRISKLKIVSSAGSNNNNSSDLATTCKESVKVSKEESSITPETEKDEDNHQVINISDVSDEDFESVPGPSGTNLATNTSELSDEDLDSFDTDDGVSAETLRNHLINNSDFMEIKMVVVINMALNLSTGAVAKQTQHALYGIGQEIEECDLFWKYYLDWQREGQDIVIVRGKSTQHLTILGMKADEQGLPNFEVNDPFLTKQPRGEITALAVFGDSEDIDQIMGKLTVL